MHFQSVKDVGSGLLPPSGATVFREAMAGAHASRGVRTHAHEGPPAFPHHVQLTLYRHNHTDADGKVVPVGRCSSWSQSCGDAASKACYSRADLLPRMQM